MENDEICEVYAAMSHAIDVYYPYSVLRKLS